MCIYIYIYQEHHAGQDLVVEAKRRGPIRYGDHAFLGKDAIVSKAPKGNGIGATGSKTPHAYYIPCCSLLGMVLRTWVWF